MALKMIGQRKCRALAQVVVPPRVLEFLAHKITTNVRELEGALNRLVAHTQGATETNVFEDQLWRLFLLAPDRTRAGRAPVRSILKLLLYSNPPVPALPRFVVMTMAPFDAEERVLRGVFAGARGIGPS